MDHAVCAIGDAELAFMPHKEMLRAFERRPPLGFAVWQKTLIDAAIFRERQSHSGRNAQARLAHLFCELFYRASASGITEGNSCAAPFSQAQIGEALGMADAASLRRTRSIEFRAGVLTVKDWKRLAAAGDFGPEYLDLKRPARI